MTQKVFEKMRVKLQPPLASEDRQLQVLKVALAGILCPDARPQSPEFREVWQYVEAHTGPRTAAGTMLQGVIKILKDGYGRAR